MRILITGGSGFIGSELTKLLKKNHEVLCTDVKTLDVCSIENVKDVFNSFKPEVIVHLAAVSNPKVCEEKPEFSYKINVTGTKNVLTAGVSAKKIIVMSSAHVYESNNKPLTEDSKIKVKGDNYTMQKKEVEKLAKTCNNTIILRPFNQEGPGRTSDFFTTQVIQAIREGTEYLLFNPNSIKDYLDVRDGVRAILLVIEKGMPGETYNICSGNGIKKIDYVRMVERILDKKAKIKIVEDKDNSIAIGDNTKLRRLGWLPKYSIEETIRDQIKELST